MARPVGRHSTSKRSKTSKNSTNVTMASDGGSIARSLPRLSSIRLSCVMEYAQPVSAASERCDASAACLSGRALPCNTAARRRSSCCDAINPGRMIQYSGQYGILHIGWRSRMLNLVANSAGDDPDQPPGRARRLEAINKRVPRSAVSIQDIGIITDIADSRVEHGGYCSTTFRGDRLWIIDAT
jgi:hypothetical protein